MKISLIIVLVLISSLLVNAQEPEGIQFETGLSWAQLKEKARKEKKYIFLDGYTTTCGPCRMMAREIFPQAVVGEFFNKNFLNVAVQFDVTKKDNQQVRAWYKDAAAIAKKYKVNSYPTYLFFSPEGELVHSIFSPSQTADEFITKAKGALDPKLQYQSLTKQYRAGNRNPEFLLTILKSAMSNHDKVAVAQISPLYFSTQKDLLSEENLKLLAIFTAKTTDAGFSVFRNHGVVADLVLGKGKSAEMVKTIIFNELIVPALRINGTATNYGSGMVAYSGTLNPDVNWDELKSKLDGQYPDLSESLLMSAKLTYLDWSGKWAELNHAIFDFFGTKKDGITLGQLNDIAGSMFRNCDDQKVLEGAATWTGLNMARAQDESEKIMSRFWFANLLYKSGKKEEAINELEGAAKGSTVKTYFDDTLEKMRKGEKTW